jgi:hypothetical protein
MDQNERVLPEDLTRRANQRHAFTIARISEPAPAGRPGREPALVRRCWEPAGCRTVRATSKNLTRRANHRHSFIIAGILEPAPEHRLRVFCLELFESDGSRGRTIFPRSASRQASQRAAVRALFCPARKRAGTRRGQGARPREASLIEIGFAPEMIASGGHAAYSIRIEPHLVLRDARWASTS